MSIPAKTDYNSEFKGLIRHQYQFAPKFNAILEKAGAMSQEIENALQEIFAVSDRFGVVVDEKKRLDLILKTANTFGVSYGVNINFQDLVERIKAHVFASVSSGKIKEIEELSEFVYGYKSDVFQSELDVMLTVRGDISSNNGRKARVLYEALLKMMPTTVRFTHLLESRDSNFSFDNFNGGDGLYDSDTESPNVNASMSFVVIDESGEVVV